MRRRLTKRSAHLLSDLERAKELLSELEKPQYRAYVRFAVAWCELDRAVSALEPKIQERSAEKSIGTVEALCKALITEN